MDEGRLTVPGWASGTASGWTSGDRPTPGERAVTVADLLERAVSRNPHSTAVVAGDDALTHAELDARANRLAHYLQAVGVGPDVAVGVCLPRGLDLAVSLVAVIKAGGACVPLDPSYPRERLHLMVDDAAPAALVTNSGLESHLPATTATVVRVDADVAAWAGRPPIPPPRVVAPDHLAYVIYTSGSTGRPKGVMLTHRGLVNHHRAAVALYDLSPGDRVLQFCSIGFDASIEEMFPTWAAGGAVVFRPEDAPLLGRGWLAWLRHQRVTVMNLPTAYWHQWTSDLEALGESAPPTVRLVVVGGERALGSAYRAWARLSGGRSRWVNAYGPTEATCMSTVYGPPHDGDGGGDDDGGDPLIGRPLPNTTVHVIDDSGAPVPPGETGELLIGGAGLARGYLNDGALTAQRFVETATGERVYRTGDLVRLLPGGDLEYVGRFDDQVKIQGFRVECGDVEAALGCHPQVAGAVVVARRDAPGDDRLVGYVVGTQGAAPTSSALRRFLVDRLPGHMVPSTLVVLDAFPLTANGKVDRAALPAPAQPGAAGSSRGSERLRSAAEDRVARVWARVLGLAAVGVDDDFFELGGHSLLATQVVAQLQEELGTVIPLRAIFEAPTVAGLAAVLEAEGTGSGPAPPLGPQSRAPGDRLPLSLAQEQMWALEAAVEPLGLFNVTALHRFDRPVDENALRAALAYMVERHETLRTCFTLESGRPWQTVAPTTHVELAVTNLGTGTAAERDEGLQRRIAEEDARPFDPADPPLLRAHLFRLDDQTSRLAVTFDHLICDGTAASIFVTELTVAYDALASGREPELPPLEVQFADFAVWQRTQVTDDALRRQLEWWVEALAGVRMGPAVPFDRFPTAPTRRIASRPVTLDAGTRRLLDEVARSTGSTVFMATVAAVLALFARHGRTTDMVVSTTVSGRNRAELEGLIGVFSGMSRIRADLSGDPSFTGVVARVRDHVLAMFENQDLPFMRVRRALFPDFPTEALALAAALPVELQYFHTSHDEWSPSAHGARPRGDRHDQELFFRGQLHPLSVTLLDDGTEISGALSYKLDFYRPETIDGLAGDLVRLAHAVGTDPSLRLSELPVTRRPGA